MFVESVLVGVVGVGFEESEFFVVVGGDFTLVEVDGVYSGWVGPFVFVVEVVGEEFFAAFGGDGLF